MILLLLLLVLLIILLMCISNVCMCININDINNV